MMMYLHLLIYQGSGICQNISHIQGSPQWGWDQTSFQTISLCSPNYVQRTRLLPTMRYNMENPQGYTTELHMVIIQPYLPSQTQKSHVTHSLAISIVQYIFFFSFPQLILHQLRSVFCFCLFTSVFHSNPQLRPFIRYLNI